VSLAKAVVEALHFGFVQLVVALAVPGSGNERRFDAISVKFNAP